jgi:pyroglutamyl-peptidase
LRHRAVSSPAPTPRVLLTGFEPFGGEDINVSWKVACALDGRVLAGAEIQALCLPTEFGASLEVLYGGLRRYRPTHVLCLGQAAGRAELSIERVAVNIDDARIADNAGAQPVDEPVVAGAPVAYFSRWPVKRMVHAAQQAGFAAAVSSTAGSFVCNHVFFGLMHRLRRNKTVGGFMHLPLLPEQAARFPGWPTMPLSQQVDGTRVMLESGVGHAGQADLRVSGGLIA